VAKPCRSGQEAGWAWFYLLWLRRYGEALALEAIFEVKQVRPLRRGVGPAAVRLVVN